MVILLISSAESDDHDRVGEVVRRRLLSPSRGQHVPKRYARKRSGRAEEIDDELAAVHGNGVVIESHDPALDIDFPVAGLRNEGQGELQIRAVVADEHLPPNEEIGILGKSAETDVDPCLRRVRDEVFLQSELPLQGRPVPAVRAERFGKDDVPRRVDGSAQDCRVGDPFVPDVLLLQHAEVILRHHQIESDGRGSLLFQVRDCFGELGAQEGERLADLAERLLIDIDEHDVAASRIDLTAEDEAAVLKPVLDILQEQGVREQPCRDCAQDADRGAAKARTMNPLQDLQARPSGYLSFFFARIRAASARSLAPARS